MSFFVAVLYIVLMFAPILLMFWVVLLYAKNKFAISTEPQEPITFPQHLNYLLFALVVAYNVFAYTHIPGIGYSLMLSTISIMVVYSIHSSRRNTFVWMTLIVSLISAASLVIRANEFAQTVNTIIWFVLLVSLLLYSAFDSIYLRGLWLFGAIIKYKLQALFNIPAFIKSSDVQTSQAGKIVNHFKTIVFSLIVGVVFIGILSQADPVFSDIMSNFLESIGMRLILSIVIVCIATMLFSIHAKAESVNELSLRFLSLSNVVIPIALTCAIFAIFLFIQARYLFAGNDSLLVQYGLTYSEYVRRGFVELLLASVIGAGLWYLSYLKYNETPAKSLRIVNIVLIAELFLLLISAWQRDILYITIYGITRIRIYGAYFLVSLGLLLFIALLVTLKNKLEEKLLFFTVGGLIALTSILFTFVNVDGIIASYTPPQSRRADYFYISNLSEDAVASWNDAISETKDFYNGIHTAPVTSSEDLVKLADMKLAMLSLHYRYLDLEDKYGQENLEDLSEYDRKRIENLREWQAFNYSEYSAFQLMQANATLYQDTLQCLIKEIYMYQRYFEVDLYQEEYDRFFVFEYPTLGVSLGQHYTPLSIKDKPAGQMPINVDGINETLRIPNSCD